MVKPGIPNIGSGHCAEGDMKTGSLVFLLLALSLPSAAHAQSPCSRVGQVICDSKSGMEMRCEQTASQITPIITGKRCPPVRAEKSCAETAREFEARVTRTGRFRAESPISDLSQPVLSMRWRAGYKEPSSI